MSKKCIAICLVMLMPGCSQPDTQGSDIQHIRFGILKPMPNGDYEMDIETTRIPRLPKDSGFRYGITFDNPKYKDIVWNEVMHFPDNMPNVSGDMHRVAPNVIEGTSQSSSSDHMVDQFWFDEGDPMGKYSMELYVNGVRKFNVDFEVVERKKL